jgi:hypothetical protein
MTAKPGACSVAGQLETPAGGVPPGYKPPEGWLHPCEAEWLLDPETGSLSRVAIVHRHNETTDDEWLAVLQQWKWQPDASGTHGFMHWVETLQVSMAQECLDTVMEHARAHGAALRRKNPTWEVHDVWDLKPVDVSVLLSEAALIQRGHRHG